MKKLMTMIAAVATAFGLYADATLNEAFNATNETVGVYTPATPGWATYSGAENTLNIVGATKEEQMLEIGTGNAELTRNAAANGDAAVAWPIKEDGLFIDTTIDFKTQALDTLPTLGVTDKIAIFALDTTALEEDAVPGLEKGTNLFVIAGYGAEGKALYRIDTLGKTFFTEGDKRRVAVKAYRNVLPDETAVRSGFLISFTAADGTVSPLSVFSAYALDAEGKVDWSKDVSSTYLGGVRTAAKLTKRVNDKQLFLSADAVSDDNGSLTAIGFKGNAKIASIAFTEADPGFGDDAQVMSIAQDSVAITNVTGALAFDKDKGVITGVADAQITIYPAFTKDIVKVSVGNVVISETKAESYGITFADGGVIKAEEWDTAATVGDKKFPYIFGNDANTCAIAYVNANGGTLKLAKSVTVGDAEAEVLNFTGSDVVLDLNGQTITISGENKTLSNTGKLTITDSSVAQTGKIVGMVINSNNLIVDKGIIDGMFVNSYGEVAGVTTISNGTFNGAVMNVTEGASEASIDPDAIKIIAVGGKFLQDVNTKGAVEGFLPAPVEKTYEVVSETIETVEYWKVQERVAEIIATFKVDDVVYAAETNTVAFTPKAPANPKKEGYTFTGWYPAITEISESKEYVAQFEAILLTATFVDEDGTELYKDDKVAYNMTPVFKGETPTKTGYTFKGWTPAPAQITENKTYTATYTANTYDITYTWVDNEGTTVDALVNTLPTTFTFGGEAIALTAQEVTLTEAYTSVAFNPATVTTDAAEPFAVTVTLTKKAEKVDPDQPIPVPQEKTPEQVAEEMNTKGIGNYLNVPAKVTDAAAYTAMFAAKPDGKGAVIIDLKTEVETEIKAELANTATSGSMLKPDAETSEVTITARPGLFYGIKAVGDVTTLGAASAQNWVQASGNTVNVLRPTVNGNAAFFQAVCSPKAPPANN